MLGHSKIRRWVSLVIFIWTRMTHCSSCNCQQPRETRQNQTEVLRYLENPYFSNGSSHLPIKTVLKRDIGKLKVEGVRRGRRLHERGGVWSTTTIDAHLKQSHSLVNWKKITILTIILNLMKVAVVCHNFQAASWPLSALSSEVRTHYLIADSQNIGSKTLHIINS